MDFSLEGREARHVKVSNQKLERGLITYTMLTIHYLLYTHSHTVEYAPHAYKAMFLPVAQNSIVCSTAPPYHQSFLFG